MKRFPGLPRQVRRASAARRTQLLAAFEYAETANDEIRRRNLNVLNPQRAARFIEK